MISEKALTDYLWCPVILTEPGEMEKRFPTDREFSFPMSLVTALDTLTPNKYVLIRKIRADTFRAESYENSDLWITIPFFGTRSWIFHPDMDAPDEEDMKTQLLLVLRDAVRQFENGRWRTTIHRVRSRTSLSEREEVLETMVRRAVWLAFKQWLPKDNLSIETVTSGSNDPYVTTNVLRPEALEAERFFRQIHKIVDKEIEPAPRLDRCVSCRWTTCEQRKLAFRPIAVKGKPDVSMW